MSVLYFTCGNNEYNVAANTICKYWRLVDQLIEQWNILTNRDTYMIYFSKDFMKACLKCPSFQKAWITKNQGNNYSSNWSWYALNFDVFEGTYLEERASC